jgi:hypothetical protein
MRTFPSLMDFTTSALFLWPLFPIYIYEFINKYLCTIPQTDFGRPLCWLPWGWLLKTWLTFLLLSILLTWPIQFNPLILTN